MFFLPASQKRLLNSLNPLIFVFFVAGLILLRTTLDPIFPSLFREVDILLPISIYLGQRRNLVEGLILTVFTAHLYSLCSAANIGIFVSHYVAVFTFSRILSYAIYANRLVSILLVNLGLSFLAEFSLSTVAGFFGHGWGPIRSVNLLIGRPFLNAFFGTILYWMVGSLDHITFKAPRVSIELSEGEI